MMKYGEMRFAPRTDLSKAVPLPLPFTLFVEPTNVCNFRCEMCPESLPDYQERAGYYKRMPMRLFEKIVSDLKGWGKVKALKFYFEGEPLLNPDLPDMIRMSRDAGIAGRIELTTNASLITAAMARRLVESGLDYARISVYALEDSAHSKVTGSKYTASQVRENVRVFREVRDAMQSRTPVLYAQWLAESPEADKSFTEMFAGIVDEVGVEPRHNWNGSDGRLVTIGQGDSKRYPKQACPELFYTLAIKANGDVSACCIDWSGQLVVGNVEKSSLQEIWEGDALRNLQRLHLAKKRDQIPGCRDCTLIYNFPDDLDNLAVEEFDSRFTDVLATQEVACLP
jgi:radical SAM protein with 4Fe4S-binding SPASM domain